MKLKLSETDLQKIIKNNKNLINENSLKKENSNEKKYSPKKRLNNAINLLKTNDKSNDKIYFNKDFSECILEINDITLLSFNDLLRNDNRHLFSFKKNWECRILNLLKHKDISNWENTKNQPILIEFLYKTDKFVDPDSICASFKYPLDGLVKSGLLIDDNNKHVPLIIPRQEKRTEKFDSLIIVLSPLKDIKKYYTNSFQSIINE